MATVIIGAGIIGTSTAYYLSESSTPASDIHLIEPSPQLFASASGYAAGFLARDWFPPSLSSLGALSFDLHKELAEANNGQEKWGYSSSTSSSLEETIGERGEDWLSEGVSRVRAANTSGSVNGDGPAWLAHHGKLDIISTGDTTAQVDPLRLCQFLMAICLTRGVQLHQPAHAVSVSRDQSGALSSIRTRIFSSDPPKEIDIPCSRLVLAAGAWTPKVFSTLFPSSKVKIPITSLAGHSLLLRSPHWPASNSTSAASSSSTPAAVLLSGDVANGNCLNTDIENGNVSNENIQNGKTPNSDRKNGDVPQEHNPTKEDHFPPGFFLPPKPPPPTSSLPPSTCHAVFTTDPSNYSPELFSRLPSTIYLAGLNSATYPLPALPTDRIIHAPSIEVLKATARRLLGDDVVVEREAVCWRPVTRRGTPVVGGVEGERGVWVAAGHGAWGISLSLGTGWVVAEMVRGVVPRVDVGFLGL